MLISAGAIAFYWGSFAGPFVYDDIRAILENPTLHHLASALRPPAGSDTVSGRPLLNLSFAVNYALSGYAVWSYHLLNLVIHLLAALTLYGLIRRTLALKAADTLATLFSFFTALLWVVHPLQTESVTYVVQRAESLMGLFYLLTLYCFVRSLGEQGLRWKVLSVLACLAGAATKEVIATAPIVVFFYDRTFACDSWTQALRTRWRYYLGLASSWILLAFLVSSNGGDRGGSAGFEVGVSWVQYWLTQGEAVLRYLWLSIWPIPLVFAYGPLPARSSLIVALSVGLVLGAFLASLLGGLRGRPWGFLGIAFFLILAPTSLIPGTMQEVVEHRMYLPLACVIVVSLCLIFKAGQRLGDSAGKGTACLCTGLVLLAGFATCRRNADYRSAVSLWRSNVRERPGSAQGQALYADALASLGRNDEAAEHYKLALDLSPADQRHTDMGLGYDQAGRVMDALREYQLALEANPNLGFARLRAGRDLYQLGRFAEAEVMLRAGILESPKLGKEAAESELLLGACLGQMNRPQDAIMAFQVAALQEPESAAIHSDLATALDQVGRTDEAITEYRRSIALDPNFAAAHYNFGNALLKKGKVSEAHEEFEKALVINPGFQEAREMFGRTAGR